MTKPSVTVTTAEGVDRKSLSAVMPPSVRQSAIESLQDDEILVAWSKVGSQKDKLQKQITGALVWRLGEDRTAFVWCPVACEDSALSTLPQLSAAVFDPAAIHSALLGELIRRADDADAWIAQCLLNRTNTGEQSIMLTNGFEHIATLRALKRSVGRSYINLSQPEAAIRKPGPDLHVHNYDPEADQNRLARLIEATWIESLDCPKINGRQSGEESIQSHSVGDTQSWRIYRHNGEDVGLLLTSNTDEALSIDYTGVISTARRQGIGTRIIHDAIQMAEQKQLPVELSVDIANKPASRIYAKLGFETLRYLEVIGRFHPSRRCRTVQ